MAQERHYKVGKSLILDGTIKSFHDIFEYVPKTNIAKDMKMHFNTFQRRINNSGSFTIDELTSIADLLNIDPLVIITMAYNQFNQDRRIIKKRK